MDVLWSRIPQLFILFILFILLFAVYWMHLCMPENDSEDIWAQRCREGLGVASPSMFSVFCEGGLYIGP